MGKTKDFFKPILRNPMFIIGLIVDFITLTIVLIIRNNNVLYINAAIFALGFLLVVWALLSRMQTEKVLPKLAKLLKIFIVTCTAFVLVLFVFIQYLIISHEKTDSEQALANCSYAILLGCRVNGSTPSLMLQSRLDTAVEFLNKNPNVKIIVSGGKGADEDISEAEAMRRYLCNAGISESRIIIEDKSYDTDMEFEYCSEIIKNLSGNTKTATAIITNDFHLYRSSYLAKENGLTAYTVSAQTPEYLKLNYHIREFFSVICAWLNLF